MIRRSFKITMLVLFVLFFISSFLIKANSVSLALFSEEGAANYELLRDYGIYKNEYRRRPGIKNKKRKISYSRIRSRQSFKKGRNRLYRIRKVRRTNYSSYGTNVNYYNNTNGYVVQSPTLQNVEMVHIVLVIAAVAHVRGMVVWQNGIEIKRIMNKLIQLSQF